MLARAFEAYVFDKIKAKLAVVELDRSGGQWTVVSAGIFRPSYLQNKKLLWEGERRSPIATGQASSPLQRGGQSDESIPPDDDQRYSRFGAEAAGKPFFSALTRGIEGIKQAKAPAQQ